MKVKKQRKIVWGIISGCFLMISSGVSVFAADSDLLVDGSRLINAEESMSDEMLDFRIETVEDCPVVLSSYLSGGTARISNAGNGKVTVYGNTKAFVTCDSAELDIYLQYYKNGSWSYVNNWNYSKKDTAYLAASRTPSVTKGRYYRIKCYHAVTKNGKKESCSTATNGIPIN